MCKAIARTHFARENLDGSPEVGHVFGIFFWNCLGKDSKTNNKRAMKNFHIAAAAAAAAPLAIEVHKCPAMRALTKEPVSSQTYHASSPWKRQP